jgi:hypothetical protein
VIPLGLKFSVALGHDKSEDLSGNNIPDALHLLLEKHSISEGRVLGSPLLPMVDTRYTVTLGSRISLLTMSSSSESLLGKMSWQLLSLVARIGSQYLAVLSPV